MKKFVLDVRLLNAPFTQEECMILASLFGNETTTARDNETEMIRQFALAPERAQEQPVPYMEWELTPLIVEVARRGFILDTLNTNRKEFRNRLIGALVAHDEYIHGGWYYGGADANNIAG